MRRLIFRPVAPWIGAFLLLNLSAWESGGTNPASRFAAVRAMSWDGEFAIDRYRSWTIDRAETEDGHVYSNKAPGAAMLAVPVSRALELVLFVRGDEPTRRPPLAYQVLLSFLLQALPFALTVLLVDVFLERRGAGLAARHLACLGALWGTTASSYMNVFFGHGLTAWLLIGLTLAAAEGRHFLSGLLYGLALLSDYAVAVLLLPFVVGSLIAPASVSRPRRLAWIVAGGALPGLLWVWYHAASFGNPFATALHFQGQQFTRPGMPRGSLSGVLYPLPRPEAIHGLVLSPARGLVRTDPWVVTAWTMGVIAGVRRWLSRRGGGPLEAPLPPVVAWMTLAGLPLLVVATSCFNGWHGGACAGPRYLSPLLPSFSLLAGLSYDRWGRAGRAALWLTLVPSLVLRSLVYAWRSYHVPGIASIWTYYWGRLASGLLAVPARRAVLFWAAHAGAAALVWKARAARSEARAGVAAPAPPGTKRSSGLSA